MRIKFFFLLLALSTPWAQSVVGQTNPKPHKVAGSSLFWPGFSSGEDLAWPGFMQGWLGKVPIILDTDTVPGSVQAEGDGVLVKVSQTTASSFEFSNNGMTGVAMRGSSASNTPLAIVIALDTRYCSKVTLRWRIRSITGYFGQVNGVQCQIRAGRSGNWRNFQLPAEFRGTGTVNTYYGPVDLPSYLLNLPEVQVRWVLYEKTGNAPTQDYTCRFNVGDLEISAVKNNPPVPSADFIASSDSLALGDTVYFTDKSVGDPETWSWNFGDGFSSTQQNPWHVFTDTGIFKVQLSVSNGFAWDTTHRFLVVGTLADTTDSSGGGGDTTMILRMPEPTVLRIYPNPVQDKLLVELNGYTRSVHVRILDARGRNVVVGTRQNFILIEEDIFGTTNHATGIMELPLQNLGAGLYYLRLEQERGNYNIPFIKE